MKWRYKVLEDTGKNDEKSGKRGMVIDGQQRWYVDLLTALQELGADGWELVVVEAYEKTTTTYIFKKPVG